jgi:proline dehydrogenase
MPSDRIQPLYVFIQGSFLMRALLLFLSRREGFKDFMLRFRFFRNTAWRFVAGETIEAAVKVVRDANTKGIRASLDLLGENTMSREDAENAARQVVAMLERIKAEELDCNVSLKLTQLGFDLEDEFCYRNLRTIVQRAHELGSFVRVDMEDSSYTQRTLDIVTRVHDEFPCVGTVIQAYLYRSENDVRSLVGRSIRIRLCKGAYLEPETVAFKSKKDTDANFRKLSGILLDSGLYHGIATHDVAMIEATREHARRNAIPNDRFEFQMLYGIRRDLQLQLVRDRYNVRIYVPFGNRWYPYFMRRLAERPANILFILSNLFRD